MDVSERAKVFLDKAMEIRETDKASAVPLMISCFEAAREDGLTRDVLYVLCVTIHDCLGFGMLGKAAALLIEYHEVVALHPDLMDSVLLNGLLLGEFRLRIRTLRGLDRLDAMCASWAERLRHDPGVLHTIHGYLHLERGRFREAHESFAAAWFVAKAVDDIAYEKHRHRTAASAAIAALMARRPALAKEWDDFGDHGEDDRACGRRKWEHLRFETLRALYAGRPRLAIRLGERLLQDASDDHWSRLAFARTALLRSANGDPGLPSHPGRVQLRRKPARMIEPYHRFFRLLTLVDYRLACLAYALGAKWVDPLWLKEVPAVAAGRPRRDRGEIEARLGRARRALARMRGLATRMDDAFGSDWRRQATDFRCRYLERLAEPEESRHG